MLSVVLDRWRSLPAFQRRCILALLGFLLLMQWDQPYPSVAPLHHIPTLTLIVLAPWWLVRWPLSNAALACIVAFFTLHTIGGRWTYTMVPYDTWAEALTGNRINAIFGWTRNNYDRLVHFSFGALAVLPTLEWLQTLGSVSRRLARYLVIEFVLAASAAYELIEWALSMLLAGDAAEAYNGQQGDIWDAHRDMGLAMIGAALVLGIVIVQSKLAKSAY